VKLRLTCRGTGPLLLYDERLASPLNPYARRIAELSVQPGLTGEDLRQIARLQFEGGLYWDERLGPYVPASMLRKSLVTGARLIRAGRKIERGVLISSCMLPLAYEGPRDIEGLWGGGKSPFVDLQPVRVQSSRIDRCRPVFREWVIEAEILADPHVIEPDMFAEAARLAGEINGLGEHREYGRYRALVETL
jgi:hypothetical protein